jgi:pyruvate,water dikinase
VRGNSLSELKPYVLFFENCQKHAELVGGKNASIGRLIGLGIRTSPGFALTTQAYKQFLKDSGLSEKIPPVFAGLDPINLSAINNASVTIRQMIEEKTIPESITRIVRTSYQELSHKCGVSDVAVSVRSSATTEDQPGMSYAGQHETYLGVKGFDELLTNIRKCWSSLFTARAICYRCRMGVPHEKALMSVGVQKMVEAKASGVMFTLNPLDGDETKIVVECSWGLGEATVSGEVTPDHWVVDKQSLQVLEKIVSPIKNVAYSIETKDGKCQCVINEVDPNLCGASCLSSEEVVKIARIGRQIEQQYCCAQDIEYAIDSLESFPNNIYILQSRPETFWSSRNKVSIL